MLSNNLLRNCLYAATALSLLSACAQGSGSNGKGSPTIWQFNDNAADEANLATVAYSQGKFGEAEEHLNNALQLNQKNPQALMVGGMLYEQINRPNKARQHYEDLIIINSDDTTILGSESGKPEKMADIAKKRLRMINMKQSKLVIEEQDGAKVFNISKDAGLRQSKSAIAEAIFLKDKKKASGEKPTSEEEIKSVEVLFSDNEQNMITRFIVLKELAEKDLVTKEEFLNARMANVGALLPLSNKAPAFGLDRPVPSPDLILERITVLKDAVESRAITPQEFSAERNLIIEALLPPTPRQRMHNKAPSKDIMEAAKDLRKLEVLYDLNLITSKEKAKEQQSIEKYLGINRAEPKPAATKQTAVEAPKEVIETVVNVTEKVETSESEAVEASAPQPLLPQVSSPF